jgi:hypothetical protein
VVGITRRGGGGDEADARQREERAGGHRRRVRTRSGDWVNERLGAWLGLYGTGGARIRRQRKQRFVSQALLQRGLGTPRGALEDPVLA